MYHPSVALHPIVTKQLICYVPLGLRPKISFYVIKQDAVFNQNMPLYT